MDVIFTDLDGTLLDRETYSWAGAAPALDRLRRSGIPWVLVTSKTRAEVELWRKRLGNQHPFIVENGAAAFVPLGYFRDPISAGTYSADYVTVRWGAPHSDLVQDLRAASTTAHCPVRGFADMSAEEVARLCSLPLEEAALAREREYDEPFLILDRRRTASLLDAITRLDRTCLRGGRLYHITGRNDKAAAVRFVAALYAREHTSIRTIGLGDGWNDLAFLQAVNVPALIRSPDTGELRLRLPRAIVSGRTGPAGWNSVVLSLMENSGPP